MKKSEPRVLNQLLFHAKLGGDLDGPTFNTSEVFFATSAQAALLYAEHVMVQSFDNDKQDLLANGIVVFPVLLTLARPAFLDQETLSRIASANGVAPEKVQRFVEDFEDSVPGERQIVFAWLRDQCFDGAILPLDSMPVFAGGDLCMRKSYVAFNPEAQVRFALPIPGAEGCRWSPAQDLEREADDRIEYF